MIKDPKKYPIFNTNTTSLEGEEWIDIPGFEDEYQLSNFGRVKSLGRWVNYGRCDTFRPERIRKAGYNKRGNNKYELCRQIKLHKNRERYSITVSRYVYFHFVAPFDLDDHSLIITRKDGDNLNHHYKNLELSTISEIAKEGYATNMRTSPYQLNIKPVTQYDKNGKMLATFESSKQAATITKIPFHYIQSSASTKERMAGGYYWRYGKPKTRINLGKKKKIRDLPSDIGLGNSQHYYLNRSIENIENEKWKTIKGFEGFYEISDHGRIKSLRRLKVVSPRQKRSTQYWTKEFIMKQTFVKSYNQYLKESTYTLTVRLKKEGTISSHPISRLVYQAFGHKTNVPDLNFIHIDGDNFNNHISNLKSVTLSEIRKLEFAKNRRKSYVANLPYQEQCKLALNASEARKRPVVQYDFKGERIAGFTSIREAAEAIGIVSSAISNALNGRLRSAGGFIWKQV